MKRVLIFFCIILVTGCAWNPGTGRGYNRNVPGSYYFKSTPKYHGPVYNRKYYPYSNRNRKWNRNYKWKHNQNKRKRYDSRYINPYRCKYCW